MLTLSDIKQRKFKLFPSSKLGKLYLISSFFTILAIVLSLVLATKVYNLDPVDFTVPIKGNSTSTKIVIVTRFVDIDTTAGTLTADWYPLADSCENPEQVVNIYFDRNLLISPAPDPSQIVSDQRSDQPVFQFNTKSRCAGSNRYSFPTFRTVAKLVGGDRTAHWTGSSIQYYPLDLYIAQFSLFAQLNSTNASVRLMPDRPFGTVINFQINLNKTDSRNTDDGLFLRLDVKRSVAVRFLVIVILLANWFATIAFLWITVASLLWPERVVKEMFVIPIAALFAFSTVRSCMPGAPAGFGATMDFVGVLPNLTAMAIFSATLLFVVLLRRTRSQDEGDDDDDESVYGRIGRVERQKPSSIRALDHDGTNYLDPISGKEGTAINDTKPDTSHDANRLSLEKNRLSLDKDHTLPVLSKASHVAEENGDDTKR